MELCCPCSLRSGLRLHSVLLGPHTQFSSIQQQQQQQFDSLILSVLSVLSSLWLYSLGSAINLSPFFPPSPQLKIILFSSVCVCVEELSTSLLLVSRLLCLSLSLSPLDHLFLAAAAAAAELGLTLSLSLSPLT